MHFLKYTKCFLESTYIHSDQCETPIKVVMFLNQFLKTNIACLRVSFQDYSASSKLLVSYSMQSRQLTRKYKMPFSILLLSMYF